MKVSELSRSEAFPPPHADLLRVCERLYISLAGLIVLGRKMRWATNGKNEGSRSRSFLYCHPTVFSSHLASDADA